MIKSCSCQIAFLFFCFGSFTYGQTLPIDFESSQTWSGFDGVVMTTTTNPYKDGQNSSQKVGRMVKGFGQNWAGAYINLSNGMDFISYNTFSVKLYSHKNNTRLLLKVENKTNASLNYAVERTMTKSNEWETVSFDFSQIPFNSYDRITLIFDNGVVGNGSTNFTYYVDDITLYRVGDPLPPCEENFTGNFPNTTSYELIWNDEFDAVGPLCYENWTYDLGTGNQGWGNFEAQTYTNRPENIHIENGVLKITALKSGNNYTSARVKTQQIFAMKYGKIEIRAKLPLTAGTWPAVWLLGENNPTVGWPACGEIDIIEQFSDKSKNISTAHWQHDGNYASYGLTANITNPNDFNNYTLEWTPTSVSTSLNGVQYWVMTISNIDAFQESFFLVMNLALGGNKGAGAIDPNFTQDSLEIDYVRVYQNNSGSHGLSTVDVNSPQQITVIQQPDGWHLDSYEFPISRINLYTMSGKRINDFNPKSTTAFLSKAGLSNSLYLVEVFSGNHRSVFKLYKSN